MTMSLFLLGVGVLLTAHAIAFAVAVSAEGRRELARWVSSRLRGYQGAAAALTDQARNLDAAALLASVGIVTVGIGLAGLMRDLPLLLKASSVFLLAVPLAVTGVYALPRAVGRRWPDRVARGLKAPLQVLARAMGGLFPVDAGTRSAELVEAFKSGSTEEVFSEQEIRVISGVLAFNSLPAREVMTPRTDIVAVEEGAVVAEVGRLFSESGFARIPVYRGDLDNIVGMVFAFDLLKIPSGADLPVRPVAMAPTSKRCADLLLEMQRDRRQLAVLLDEFGGTAGIVTLDDLLKQLVDELFEGPAEAAGPQTSRAEFDASTPCEDVALAFGVELPQAAESIGGLLVRASGRIPRTGERFSIAGLEIDVLAASPTRVERVAVRRAPVPVEVLRTS